MATKIRLGARDAALVFRADGALEAVMPLLHEGAEPPSNVIAAHALMWAYGDERMMAAIVDAWDGEPQIVPDACSRSQRDRSWFNRLN
jgi:hypothetical protein